MVLRLASSIVPLSVGRVCSKFQVQRCKDQRYNDTSADIHFDSMGDLELRSMMVYAQSSLKAVTMDNDARDGIMFLFFGTRASLS